MMVDRMIGLARQVTRVSEAQIHGLGSRVTNLALCQTMPTLLVRRVAAAPSVAWRARPSVQVALEMRTSNKRPVGSKSNPKTKPTRNRLRHTRESPAALSVVTLRTIARGAGNCEGISQPKTRQPTA